MTFVIIGGGIDLSVGCDPGPRSDLGDDRRDAGLRRRHPLALMVGTGAARRRQLRASSTACSSRTDGSRPFIATLAMLAGARGLAEIIAQRRTQLVSERGLIDFFGGSVLGIPGLVIIFALRRVAGWVVLNRTTYGRRTLAVGGNPRRRAWPASGCSATSPRCTSCSARRAAWPPS
jgi:ribose transport system permease protein